MPKIPGNCPVCGRALELAIMELYLKLYERSGHDPLEAKDGILCGICWAHKLADIASDDTDPQQSDLNRIFGRMKSVN